MKRKFSLLGAYLISVLLLCIGITTMCACSRESGKQKQESVKKDAKIVAEKTIVKLGEISIEDVGDAIRLQQQLNENYAIDSAIRTMPGHALTNVTSVVLKKNKRATVNTLVEEYFNNRQIYDNLPSATAPPASKEGEPVTKVNVPDETVISINMRDTIIDGKKYRVDTKLIRYENE